MNCADQLIRFDTGGTDILAYHSANPIARFLHGLRQDSPGAVLRSLNGCIESGESCFHDFQHFANRIFHYTLINCDDNEYRIVRVYPDVVALESITFTDLGDGRSRLTIHSVYPALEARDGMVASGMETGVTEGYERLDKLAAGL